MRGWWTLGFAMLIVGQLQWWLPWSSHTTYTSGFCHLPTILLFQFQSPHVWCSKVPALLLCISPAACSDPWWELSTHQYQVGHAAGSDSKDWSLYFTPFQSFKFIFSLINIYDVNTFIYEGWEVSKWSRSSPTDSFKNSVCPTPEVGQLAGRVRMSFRSHLRVYLVIICKS